MFNIVLVEPEIPANTGNIIRLCANTEAQLHLIEPLGFQLNDAKMRRAGLDYHEWVLMRVHRSWEDFILSETISTERCFALTTHGESLLHQHTFTQGDWFIFGPETRGLGTEIARKI